MAKRRAGSRSVVSGREGSVSVMLRAGVPAGLEAGDGLRPRPLCSALTLSLAIALTSIGACGAGHAPLAARTLPDAASERDAAVHSLGSALWDALTLGTPWSLLLEDDELRLILSPEDATRFSVRRGDVRSRLREAASRVPAALSGASYVGVCAQDSRDEPGGSALGLVRRTWVVSRALVAGRIGGGSRRIALWVDGTFVATTAGFRAVDLERIETPRWEHSDLEILACDVSEGL